MSDQRSNDEVAAALCAKLKECDLTEAERAMLNAIFAIARDITTPTPTLDSQFDGCFEPGEAGLIMQYQVTPSSISKSVGHTSSITKTTVH